MGDFWFRALYDELLDEEKLSSTDVLRKWHFDAKAALHRLARYGEERAIHWKLSPKSNRDDQISYVDSWNLYALSRISDLLLLPFQHGDYDGSSWYPQITLAQRTDYWLSLGMIPFAPSQFHPFYHEVVEVEQSATPSEPITVVEELWPGFLLGHMMFCRAGVRISGGTDYVVKQIAEGSTLYFTFWRKNRPHQDLSHGCGQNSQWGTEFRRDYVVDETYFYNMDGTQDILNSDPESEPEVEGASPQHELKTDERIELLTNRCFLRTAKAHHDLWPYDDFYIARANSQ